MDIYTDTIGNRIKKARLELGFSQVELADAIDVSQPTVANWENDSHEPRQIALNKLAVTLKTNPAWLRVGQTGGNQKAHSTETYLRRPIHHIPVLSWPISANADEIIKGPAHDYLAFSLDAVKPFALVANDPAMADVFPIGSAIIFDATFLELIDGTSYLFNIDGEIVLRRWRSAPNRLETLPNQSTVDAHLVFHQPKPIARALISLRRH